MMISQSCQAKEREGKTGRKLGSKGAVVEALLTMWAGVMNHSEKG
jgi:hypothetical protein